MIIPVTRPVLGDSELAAIASVLDSGYLVQGSRVAEFERIVAEHVGLQHAVAVSSCTSALRVALLALGIGPGDKVIVAPYSWVATANVIELCGATPVFVDIDPATFNLDPARLEDALTPRTKAIQPVHLYGQCADMAPILEIATRRGVPVVEDACQAIGAEYHGKAAGSLGTMGAFSFYPTKNLGAAGDAGAVTTDDDDLAALLRSLRLHGSSVTYHHDRVGGNFRLDAIQAAVLSAKLPRLDHWNERRRAIAARYRELLGKAAASGHLTLPSETPGVRHTYHQYVVRVGHGNRDAIRRRLSERGVGSSVFYPIPLHLQDCFLELGGREGDFPAAEKAAREVLALPMFAELTEAEIERVAEALLESLD